ncbi:two component, sigma54 specific, transcriptional regulator, Fis family [Saccharicrinis carchari]|uniref:Two component, sigma54 specific, transcriptional regulator, Fis family n=1 Tax=Saccharicrinis carchari TaxID=1168039 RepID=A0A521E8A6_SACCC|nr:sigma-54 dependent transcriptional regulator [Saccharicrinis carchari]SMO79661.1 two component, sigma54 specific, transcriptional regulator, Fis family [Saccharicrinis carchari]
MENLKILILDDEKRITEKLKYHLQKREFIVFTANTPNEGFAVLKTEKPSILILDIMLPGINGLDVLTKVKEDFASTEVIMISGYGDMDMVIEAMRKGASDFIRKPFQLMDIQVAVERTGKFLALQKKLENAENIGSLVSKELEGMIEKDFIGESTAIKKVIKIALKAAQDNDVNVLVTGENGTGKEIISRIIHYGSPRMQQVFAPVNSSAIPATLLESEFFGHVKGAFTDAREDKKGYFELANKGTLFLDEIADMPFSLQAKLLRVIEENKVKKVGSNKEFSVDVRIISATNKNIEQLIRDNKFRIDLYHRINTIEIHIPPLRERPEDIPLLLLHFVKSLARKKNIHPPTINTQLLKKLQSYHFPGNVRELRNMVERALILLEGDELMPEDFPLKADHKQEKYFFDSLDLEKNERQLIVEALKRCNMNQTQAADTLGISRDALKRKIKKFGIEIGKNIV